MRRYSVGLFLASVLVVGVPLAVDSQPAQLTILNSGPTGEINQLQDANEIRVIFSEPMVPLGRVPSNPDAAVDPHHAGDPGRVSVVGHDDPDLHAGSGDAAALRDALHGAHRRERRRARPGASSARLKSSRSRRRRSG